MPTYQVIVSAFVTVQLPADSPEEAARAYQRWRDDDPERAIAGGQVLLLQDPLPRLFATEGECLGAVHRGRIVGK